MRPEIQLDIFSFPVTVSDPASSLIISVLFLLTLFSRHFPLPPLPPPLLLSSLLTKPIKKKKVPF